MSHPRIEEVSDSDDAINSDPDEVDLDDFDDSDILRRVPDSQSQQAPSQQQVSELMRLQQQAQQQQQQASNSTQPLPTTADRSAYAKFQCLYPVYFDASRSRAEGRRVSSDLAVRNPIAREIATACSRLRLPTLLEPDKIHPKDWANPGRVKVGLRKSGSSSAKNKHHLYILIAQHLRANPTTEESAGLKVKMGGQMQPEDGKPYPRPAVPRGWKMGELLPYMSPAMTGGGVSENLFKDMMKEMQGGPGGMAGNPMAALMGGAGGGGGGGGGSGAEDSGGKKKKDKKGKGKA